MTRKPLDIEDWPEPSVLYLRCATASAQAEIVAKQDTREIHIPISDDRLLAMIREATDILWRRRLKP